MSPASANALPISDFDLGTTDMQIYGLPRRHPHAVRGEQPTPDHLEA